MGLHPNQNGILIQRFFLFGHHRQIADKKNLKKRKDAVILFFGKKRLHCRREK